MQDSAAESVNEQSTRFNTKHSLIKNQIANSPSKQKVCAIHQYTMSGRDKLSQTAAQPGALPRGGPSQQPIFTASNNQNRSV